MTASTLRQLLARPGMLVAPGAHDAIGARQIEQAGFDAVYMTGGVTSMAHGFPDFGLVDFSEMAGNALRITRATRLPVIADADTGYGNELNVIRTVREYELRGVAGLHIEDQVSPKRCGHLEGKEVIPRAEFVSKIRAAAEARRNADTVIIARTDARAVLGMDEAVARMNEALAAGADIAFVEAMQTMEEIAAVPRLVRGPCFLNLVPGGKTPLNDLREAEAMGYKVCILPGLLVTAQIEAGDAALSQVKATRQVPVANTPIGDIFRRFGAEEWDALRERYGAGAVATRTKDGR
ncbi:isocitrate lyase/PEP mutase family protein [Variovorax sp. PBL-H6]|uniref:isocitrate lyase/PEP mutase family protein n=1 Tax=Variovorax sp. PBL-H6 TaxID=434009 RepID=UPI0013A55BC9|nr:isocitrate lyase/PEP mutase family protein [Variovorax sp. PBL-H6]